MKEIPEKAIYKGKKIGAGSFGDVFQGDLPKI